jgi:hypothetical protein
MEDKEHVYIKSSLEPRVSSLETEMRSISRSVDQLTEATRLANENTNRQITKLADLISMGRATSWPLVLTACGLVLAIVSTIGTLALNPIKEAVKDNQGMRDSINANTALSNYSLSLADKDFSILEERSRLIIQRLDKIEANEHATMMNRFTKEDYQTLVAPRLDDLNDKISDHQSDGHPLSVLKYLDAKVEGLRKEYTKNNEQ